MFRLEDGVLAARADEAMYTVDSLLLYSTVCGAGLDTGAAAGRRERGRTGRNNARHGDPGRGAKQAALGPG